jgi:CheY-like chemotaxis protein/two-component sensor histidine kinase
LIEDLLDVSRIVSGKLELTLSAVDLVPIVQAAVDVIRPSADAKRIRVAVELEAPPCFVSGDSDRLQQVLVNLLSNAVKFTPAEGRIGVRLQTVDGSYSMAVEDSGIGIAPEFLPQVFDRFRQADGSLTRQHGGLGLGLAIARDLIALHQGELRASSPGPGKGATFTVVLPKLLAQAAPAREPRARAEVHLDGLAVLVTDDDADAREVAREALSTAGARVVVAADAAGALTAIDNQEFDVFVCDIQMPKVDGYGLLSEMRQRTSRQGRFVPAVAVTAHAGVAEQERVRRAGYQEIVIKPYDFTTLAEAVAEAAGRT